MGEGGGWTVDDELPKISENEDEWWENHGWCLRASEPDSDFETFSWDAFYLLRGGRGSWVIPDEGLIRQTIVVAGEFADRTTMRDNEFWVRGSSWGEIEPLNSLSVERNGAGTWRAAGIVHSNEPPIWTVESAIGPIEQSYELSLAGGPFTFGDFGNTGGAEVLADATGSLTIDGVEHRVVGFGQHERAFTPNVAGVARGRGGWATEPIERRHLWHCGATDDGVRVTFLANQPAEPPETINSHLLLPTGYSAPFRRSDLTVTEAESWLDPRSGVTVPSAWAVRIETNEATLKYFAQSFGRAYYVWDYVRGYIGLLYWMVADAEGSWRHGDHGGEFGRMRYVAHTHRPMFSNPLDVPEEDH